MTIDDVQQSNTAVSNMVRELIDTDHDYVEAERRSRAQHHQHHHQQQQQQQYQQQQISRRSESNSRAVNSVEAVLTETFLTNHRPNEVMRGSPPDHQQSLASRTAPTYSSSYQQSSGTSSMRVSKYHQTTKY